jgi:hypothetical protein
VGDELQTPTIVPDRQIRHNDSVRISSPKRFRRDLRRIPFFPILPIALADGQHPLRAAPGEFSSQDEAAMAE